MKEFIDNNPETEGEEGKKHKFIVWQFFDVNTGLKVFEKNNRFCSSAEPEDVPGLHDHDLRFLGLLCKNNSTKKGKFNVIPDEAEFEKKEEEDKQEPTDEFLAPSEASDSLNLIFAFAKDAVKKSDGTKKSKNKK